jgi:hypothetical protein
MCHNIGYIEMMMPNAFEVEVAFVESPSSPAVPYYI